MNLGLTNKEYPINIVQASFKQYPAIANQNSFSKNTFCSPTKICDFPTINKIKGNIRLKYNSSRKDVAKTIAELFPTLIPSFHKKIVAIAVPPTAEGVIVEPNSHNKTIFRLCIHDNSPPDKTLILKT